MSDRRQVRIGICTLEWHIECIGKYITINDVFSIREAHIHLKVIYYVFRLLPTAILSSAVCPTGRTEASKSIVHHLDGSGDSWAVGLMGRVISAPHGWVKQAPMTAKGLSTELIPFTVLH